MCAAIFYPLLLLLKKKKFILFFDFSAVQHESVRLGPGKAWGGLASSPRLHVIGPRAPSQALVELQVTRRLGRAGLLLGSCVPAVPSGSLGRAFGWPSAPPPGSWPHCQLCRPGVHWASCAQEHSHPSPCAGSCRWPQLSGQSLIGQSGHSMNVCWVNEQKF